MGPVRLALRPLLSGCMENSRAHALLPSMSSVKWFQLFSNTSQEPRSSSHPLQTHVGGWLSKAKESVVLLKVFSEVYDLGMWNLSLIHI